MKYCIKKYFLGIFPIYIMYISKNYNRVCKYCKDYNKHRKWYLFYKVKCYD